MVVRVTSRQHALVLRCRAVADRREETAVLLDGEHLAAEALSAGLLMSALLTDDARRPVARAAEAAGVHVYEGTASVLDAASPTHTSSGVVAIAEWVPHAPGALFHERAPFVVGLLGVQDPGNVGSVIRSADALGATGVLTLEGSADPSGWKALRGAMGSTFRVPVAKGLLDLAVTDARAHGVRIIATVAEGGIPLDAADLQHPFLLLLGNEGAGLDRAIVRMSDLALTVPMRPGVSSLNVAVTAGLVLWESYRQRTSTANLPQ